MTTEIRDIRALEGVVIFIRTDEALKYYSCSWRKSVVEETLYW